MKKKQDKAKIKIYGCSKGLDTLNNSRYVIKII